MLAIPGALTRQQGGGNRLSGINRSDFVRQNCADQPRPFLVRASLYGGQAGYRLDNRIVNGLFCQGTSLTEARHRDINNVRRYCADLTIRNPKPLNNAGTKVLYQYICVRCQFFENRPTLG